MCEIVILVEPHENPMYEVGDILAVQPDGWNWGKLELSNPNWRIIKFPGVDPAKYEAMAYPLQEIDIKGEKTLLKVCAGNVGDVTAIKTAQVGRASLSPVLETDFAKAAQIKAVAADVIG